MREQRVVIAAALGSLVLIGASYWFFFVRPESRPEAARPIEPETLRLEAASGTVEVAGPDGTFRPAGAGQLLSAKDRIRTGDEGFATLKAADGSTVKLLAATEARIGELRRELKRLSLGVGMVEADVVDDPARVFELSLDEDGGKARTRGARFTASSNGQGTSAVAAHRGELILSARGKEVVIRSGEVARILPGAPPEAPQPIPATLFLKVTWPPATSTRSRVPVSGETAPGARVRIAGKWIRVDSKGAYKTEVSLPDGAHELDLHAEDVGGHITDEKSPRIVIDTRTDFKIQAPKWK